jgi:hypothetical protein
MKEILGLIIVCLMCSCNHSNTNNPVVLSPNSYFTKEYEQIRKIVYYGDTIAYQKMFDDFDDNFRIPEFLSYSLIMANKYDFTQAYYDVFYILTMLPQINEYECDTISFYCLDEKTRNFALEYFSLAINKGSIIASKQLLSEFCENQSFPIKELYFNKELIKKAKQNIGQ